jgi:adenylate cyclase
MVATAPQAAMEIIEWLASDNCHALDASGLIGALAAMLGDNGVPVQRLVLHLRAPHPTIFGRSIAWAPEESIGFLDLEHGEEQSERIRKSPILHVMSTRDWLVLRMDDQRWMLHDIFLGRGLIELCIAPMIHGPSERAVSAVTFGTQRREGFSATDLELLRRILPALRSAIELKIWRRTTETMLDTYIGNDPEKRILSGRVRRGDAETIEAALMFCDMQGFTELSNRLSSERVLEVLNIYFDQVVPPVTECGGEILKFMGDGLLAFFRDAAGAGQSCAAALKAARLIGERLADLSLPDVDVKATMGLHYGGVSYGNIGSGKRLDFTVIGRDVNLTSRIQGLCGRTSQPLLLSKRFVELLSLPGAASVGCHAVKGFAEPVEVFAWTESES